MTVHNIYADEKSEDEIDLGGVDDINFDFTVDRS